MSQTRRFLCNPLPAANRSAELEESEANHAIRVLKVRDGDTVTAIDGEGKLIHATAKIRKSKVFLEATGDPSVTHSLDDDSYAIRLNLAILKSDAMHWAIEKAVELGARELQPFQAERSVVQTKKKGDDHFFSKWQRIADQALKQCERLNRMEIIGEDSNLGSNPLKVIAMEEKNRSGESTPFLGDLLREKKPRAVQIRIGPEGGWTENEVTQFVEQGEIAVSLGPRVLRAETAALYSIAVASEHMRS